MLQGCRQSRKQNDNRDPISKEILNDTCGKLNQMCSSHYEMLLFTAASTLVYYGLLRVSEIVYTGPMYNDRPLQLSDASYETKTKHWYFRL